MKPIHEEQFRVRSWDVDRTNRLSMAAAFNFFQEIAGNHAELLGVGRDAFRQAGQAWILSRMSAVLDRRPLWGETLTVRTWPRGTDRLFAVRDYEIEDENRAIVARGRSGWIVLDLERMRPLRPQAMVSHVPLNEDRNALPDGIQGLEANPDLAEVGTRVPAYSDFDYNGHVNNARYVQWIQDVLPAAPIEDAESLRLDINYLSEVKPGMAVQLWTGKRNGISEPTFAVEGRVGDSGQAAFRAEFNLGVCLPKPPLP